MKFISSALLLILSAAITQSAVTPAKSAPQSDCQIVQKAYLQAGGNPAISNCKTIPGITYDNKQKVTVM